MTGLSSVSSHFCTNIFECNIQCPLHWRELNQNSPICSSTKISNYQYVLFEILDGPKEGLGYLYESIYSYLLWFFNWFNTYCDYSYKISFLHVIKKINLQLERSSRSSLQRYPTHQVNILKGLQKEDRPSRRESF
jgi:hypothetical protein